VLAFDLFWLGIVANLIGEYGNASGFWAAGILIYEECVSFCCFAAYVLLLLFAAAFCCCFLLLLFPFAAVSSRNGRKELKKLANRVGSIYVLCCCVAVVAWLFAVERRATALFYSIKYEVMNYSFKISFFVIYFEITSITIWEQNQYFFY
jgi:hypothetical protein